MTIKMICTAVLLAVSLSGAAMAAGGGVTLKDKQQAACFDDVQKLCGDLVPDVDKVTACMKTKRQQVSPSCSKFYVAQPAG